MIGNRIFSAVQTQDIPPHAKNVPSSAINVQAGEGLCYYKSGRVAVSVSNVGQHQKRFYVYDDDKEKTMLCSLNEYAVGFALNNTRGNKDRRSRLVLTGRGGVYADRDQSIVAEWKWDRKAQNAGTIPPAGVNMPLNKNLFLSFTDRFTMELTYDISGIQKHFDCGMKLKRMDSYLETAKHTGLGRLDVTIPDYRTLSMRQTDFAESMRGLRNKNNPKSQNLSDMVSNIVSGLEDHFDTYIKDKKGKPCLKLAGAKKEGWEMTCKELPKIKKTKQDKAISSGYSEALYLDDKQASTYKFNAKDTARKILLKPNGEWKTDLEIRLALCTEEHPPLPKPEHIKRSNGHYHYNHNARERHKRVGPTLRKVSTVKETPELQSLLSKRLESMTGNIKDLYLR
ncbi:hypothetical protein TrRE_jg5951 [Triparma retinervis]|uniref:FAM194 C-terminal domain-containing protein n=1 Tax=Triparma retinervis TaxID=2557542 RepID=A0A9W7CL88_9STRA|nr:hypothetical protein TrRE_jg5951 [Triparma retinervis]